MRAYNFGTGYFYSVPERILFEKLLLAGHVPKVALFIDGMNEFFLWNDRLKWARRSTDRVRPVTGEERVESLRTLLSELPMNRAADFLTRRFSEPRRHAPERGDQEELPDEDTLIARVVDRYVKNKRWVEAVARAHGVTPVFVWQPIPSYKYDLKSHLFAEGSSWSGHGKGYALMAKTGLTRPEDFTKNSLWLADIQEEFKGPVYIDQVHYSVGFSREIATRIGTLLLERNLLDAEVQRADLCR